MSFQASGLLKNDDDRRKFLAGVKKQCEDAAIERAVNAAFMAFPATHDLDVTVSGHLDPADGAGEVSIAVRGIAVTAEQRAVEAKEAAQKAADEKVAARQAARDARDNPPPPPAKPANETAATE